MLYGIAQQIIDSLNVCIVKAEELLRTTKPLLVMKADILQQDFGTAEKLIAASILKSINWGVTKCLKSRNILDPEAGVDARRTLRTIYSSGVFSLLLLAWLLARLIGPSLDRPLALRGVVLSTSAFADVWFLWHPLGVSVGTRSRAVGRRFA